MTNRNSEYHVPLLKQLVDTLDTVVLEQAGSRVAESVQRLRTLALERRTGMPGAEQRLVDELNQLEMPLAAEVIRAFTIFFDLANVAEDLNRIHTLRTRSAQDGGQRSETIAAAIDTLKQRGKSAAEVRRLIEHLCIEPIFTAHPSEAKRRTTRNVLRHLRETLRARLQSDGSADLPEDVLQRIRADVTAIWQSDLLRPTRPNVLNEIERGLFFADVLWEVVPHISRDLRRALADSYPNEKFEIPPTVRFGTWIGGDRDGHPFVTSATTAQALDMLRDTAIDRHLRYCRQLMDIVIMSDRHADGLDELKTAVNNCIQEELVPDGTLEDVSASEIGKQWLTIIEHRLVASRQRNRPSEYRSAEALTADVSLLHRSLINAKSQDVAETHVRPWLDCVRAFGLNFAGMDIRQHSKVHNTVIQEVMQLAGMHTDFSAADEETRIQLLLGSLDQVAQIDHPQLSDTAKESIALFDLLAQRIGQDGLATIGGYIISMTHEVSDILAVLWLWHQAWMRSSQTTDIPSLPIIPLFETIEDLNRAPAIMELLWEIPEYRDYVRGTDAPTQTVMIGYSDSTKDGGYLAASWRLHQSQSELASLARKHGMRLVIFHGRGGALGRGGGPAARAVLSLPSSAVDGVMRVTEQGEILAERYDDLEIAFRHLEQVTWATLLASADETDGSTQQYRQAMQRMADQSFAEYRRLVTHAGFIDYFQSATPVAEIESLPIGSRPARRGDRHSLDDLRAIPWSFAWTQSRHLLAAWYGFGTAIRSFVDESGGDWTLVREMYDQWRFFRAILDNAEAALAKSDIEIARRYRALCEDPAAGEIWTMIEDEFNRSRAAIMLVKQQQELLESTNWLRRSIMARNPSVDPLNLLQIRLLAETREQKTLGADEREVVYDSNHVLRLTINGIAAGMRTTG